MAAKGVLIPIGGNEDKGIEESESYTMDFIEDSILSNVVKEAGGPDAKIVIKGAFYLLSAMKGGGEHEH